MSTSSGQPFCADRVSMPLTSLVLRIVCTVPLTALPVLSTGCAGEDGTADGGVSDAGPDARSQQDTGAGTDAGAADDGGPRADGGPTPGGRIIVDPDNPAWLRYEGGGPFFLCGPGDPEDFLYRGSRNADGTRTGDQSDLIAKVAGTGANGIYFQAVRSHGGDGMPDHNPFIDSDPTQALDDDILSQWETWFTQMEDAGIVIYFFFYDDSARIWNTGDAVGAEEETFVTAIVDRFEHHDLLMWVVAEEYQERYSPARVSNIASAIRSADDNDHIIAVHKLSGLSFEELADAPAIDQFAIQYNVATAAELHDGMVTAWNNARGRYNLNMSEAAGHGAGSTARLKNWATALGGAYVMVIEWDIATTAISDLEDCGRLVRFMESTDLTRLEPHDELAFGATVYVLANPGRAYVAYASSPSGDLGLRGLDLGRYRLRWLDPADGDAVMEVVDVTATDTTWPTPASIGPEVALYVGRL